MKKVIYSISAAMFITLAVINVNITINGEKSVTMDLADAMALANTENVLQYTYDLSGNMIQREMVTISLSIGGGSTGETGASKLKSSVGQTGEAVATSETPLLADILSEVEITTYPNPTRGMIQVNITGDEIPKDARIYLYNMQGMLVRQLTGISATNELDISYQPAGAYVIRIVLGENNVHTMRIIKE